MKKLSYILSSLILATFMVSCDETKDDNPVLIPASNGATADFLNIPELANQYLVLDAATADGSIQLVCSQPDYGFAAAARYQVQASFSNDFTMPAVVGQPAFVNVGNPQADCSNIEIFNSELAGAIMDLLAIENPDQVPTPYMPLYLRLYSYIPGPSQTDGLITNGTAYYSNIVSIAGVSLSYIPAVEPGLPSGLFLRGGMNDWGAVSAWEFVTTTTAGVYELLDIEIGEGVEFKVADSTWGPVNLGGNGSDIEFGAPYKLAGGDNPPNIKMPSNFIGDVQLVYANSEYTITFIPAEPDTPGQGTGIYLRGGMNGWGAEPEWEFMTTDYKGNYILEGVTIGANVEFKIADSSWGDVNLGGNGDAPIIVKVGSKFTLSQGGQNLALDGPFSGTVYLTLKNAVYNVTFTPETDE